jgi:hypothetical protein
MYAQAVLQRSPHSLPLPRPPLTPSRFCTPPPLTPPLPCSNVNVNVNMRVSFFWQGGNVTFGLEEVRRRRGSCARGSCPYVRCLASLLVASALDPIDVTHVSICLAALRFLDIRHVFITQNGFQQACVCHSSSRPNWQPLTPPCPPTLRTAARRDPAVGLRQHDAGVQEGVPLQDRHPPRLQGLVPARCVLLQPAASGSCTKCSCALAACRRRPCRSWQELSSCPAHARTLRLACWPCITLTPLYPVLFSWLRLHRRAHPAVVTSTVHLVHAPLLSLQHTQTASSRRGCGARSG